MSRRAAIIAAFSGVVALWPAGIGEAIHPSPATQGAGLTCVARPGKAFVFTATSASSTGAVVYTTVGTCTVWPAVSVHDSTGSAWAITATPR
jgi:hypothetical protein